MRIVYKVFLFAHVIKTLLRHVVARLCCVILQPSISLLSNCSPLCTIRKVANYNLHILGDFGVCLLQTTVTRRRVLGSCVASGIRFGCAYMAVLYGSQRHAYTTQNDVTCSASIPTDLIIAEPQERQQRQQLAVVILTISVVFFPSKALEREIGVFCT